MAEQCSRRVNLHIFLMQVGLRKSEQPDQKEKVAAVFSRAQKMCMMVWQNGKDKNISHE